MSKNIYLRMMLPKDENDDFLGHYDLQIVGNVSFKNTSYSNPVFSYRSVGCVDVFDGDESSKVYRTSVSDYKNCNIYRWPMTITDDKYNNFIAEMSADLKSAPSNIVDGNGTVLTNKGDRYSFKTGSGFNVYLKEYHNCYHAISRWLNWMGKPDFIGKFNQEHNADVTECKPATLKPLIGSNWTLHYTKN